MEIARFFRSLEDLGLDVSGSFQVFFVVAFIFLAFILVKMGRKNIAAAQSPSGDLSARLSEIDPADYDFDGNKKVAAEPSVDFDNFFSNTSRRAEIGGDVAAVSTVPVQTGDVTVFPIPKLEDLPKPDPEEPPVTREARDRVFAIAQAAENKSDADPSYRSTEEEKFASAAFDSYSYCADGLGYFVLRAPDVPRFRAIEEVARAVGAADLEAIIGLQIKLMEMTSTSEWRARDEDDERWNSIKETTDQLIELFRLANRNDGGIGRLSTLVDAYLAGEW